MPTVSKVLSYQKGKAYAQLRYQGGDCPQTNPAFKIWREKVSKRACPDLVAMRADCLFCHETQAYVHHKLNNLNKEREMPLERQESVVRVARFSN